MLREFIGIAVNVGIVINFLFAFFVVFYERKNPGVTWAWLMVLAILPIFGWIIYLIFGFEGRKHIKFSRKAVYDEKTIAEYVQRNPKLLVKQAGVIRRNNILKIPNTEYLNNVVMLNMRSAASPYRTNNSVKLYNEGHSKFEDLMRDIKAAERFIHLQYYIVRDDELGRKIISLLADKAREGVEVKFLYDGMGNVRNSVFFNKPLKQAGGEVQLFLPPKGIRINYRNHRKLAVIDGKIGYIGGLNIGDEYLGKVKRFGFWRDTHIRVVGDCVHDMELRFQMDWNFTKGSKIQFDKKYFPDIPKQESSVPMQIVSSGPDTRWNNVHYGYFRMITEANKRIYIATPYFVPDDSILEALKTAALSGVDVRIIIPANPDHFFVYWSSLSYLGELLEAGVRCYEYTKGFIHSKVISMDGMISSVGTANLDVRSFKLNFEVNAFMYDENLTSEIDEQFKRDFKDCHEITHYEYEARSRVTKIREAFSRLISPLL
jgi:cardiolipin synthase